MNRKRVQISRASACYELLQMLCRRPLPAVFHDAEDIHKILALRSARLIEAEVSLPIHLRSGERRIEQAEVTAITAEGRSICASKGEFAPPSLRF